MKLQDLLSKTNSDRNAMKPQFNTGEIPTQQDFHNLIDGLFHIRHDSLYKDEENGLCIKAGTTGEKEVLLLYDDFNDPKFKISLKNGLQIKAANDKGISISNDGKVGIRGSYTTYGLTVADSILVNGGWLRVKGSGGLFFEDRGGGFRMIDDLWIRTYGSKNFYHDQGIMRTDGEFRVGPGGDRFIVNSGGKVGIGRKTPRQQLDVPRGIQGNSILLGAKTNEIDYPFEYESIGVANKGHNLRFQSPNSIYFHSGIDANEPDRDTSKVRMTIRENGNVGIGATNPGSSLHVRGNLTIQAGTGERGYIIMKSTANDKDAYDLLDTIGNNQMIFGSCWDQGVYFYWKDKNGRKRRAILRGDPF